MPSADEILLNELLLKREECFDVVYNVEEQIEAILGEPIDFEIPFKLPSMEKRKVKKVAKKVVKKAPFKLRKLENNESIYQITYNKGFETFIEKQIDPSPIEVLLQNPPSSVKILKIETLSSDGTVIDELYSKRF